MYLCLGVPRAEADYNMAGYEACSAGEQDARGSVVASLGLHAI